MLTLLGFAGTGSVNILVSAVITLVIIVIVFKTQQTKNKKKELIKQIKKEGFANPQVYKSTKNITKLHLIKYSYIINLALKIKTKLVIVQFLKI